MLEIFCIFLLAMLVAATFFGLGILRGRRQSHSSPLAANERLFQEIIEKAPIGVCIIRDRKFAFINDAYLQMFGYTSPDDVLDRPVEELYAEEERERQRSYARDRIAGKPVPTMYETIGLRQNGEKFAVTAWVSLVRYKGKTSSLGFVIDRSVENEMRRRLDQANRLESIGTLAGGMAHDFNNIRSAIIGYSELALIRSQENELVAGDLRQVLKAGKRARDLVQQILTFSRKQDRLMRPVQLTSVVKEVLQLVRASLPTSISLEVSLNSEATILADQIRIHQLLMNLCANAEHAMREHGGTLQIELTDYEADQNLANDFPKLTAGKYALLQIRDTGPGIPAAIREKIFEPFFTTKGVGEGTGLGLAQVHAITRSHGGYVSFADNRPHGTIFSVFLPLVTPVDEHLTETALSFVPCNAKILLVDDEPMVLEVTGRLLKELGHEITAFSDPLQALQCFQESPDDIDLVISDMTMPNMTGGDLARQLKTLRPKVPVVLCTGFSAVIDNDPQLSQMVTILEKPVDKVLLAETVDRLLSPQTSQSAAPSCATEAPQILGG